MNGNKFRTKDWGKLQMKISSNKINSTIMRTLAIVIIG